MMVVISILILLACVVRHPSEAFSTSNKNNNHNILHSTSTCTSSSSTRIYSTNKITSSSKQKQKQKQKQPINLINRRKIFENAGKTIAIASAGYVSPFVFRSYAADGKKNNADDEFEVVINQKSLLAGLSSAPVRTVIITGANSGVGLAGAKLLTASGHKVILACRTKAKADIAVQKCMDYAASSSTDDNKFFSYRRAGGIAISAECDLSSLASINKFANSVLISEGNIDTLVLNAGLAHGQGETDTVYRTVEGFEETIGVNHLGHFLLANKLQPKLAKSKDSNTGSSNGRLVSTASPVHDPNSGGGDVGAPASLGTLSGFINDGAKFTMVDGGPYDPDKAYKDSKLCNMLFMAEASRRWYPTNTDSNSNKVTVNAFSPGLIADPNGFFRNQNKGFATVFNTITKVVGVAESNEFGGSALAYLAVDPAVNGKSGGWYDSAPPGKHQLAKHAPSTEAQNVEEQKLLWDLSSKVVGIQ